MRLRVRVALVEASDAVSMCERRAGCLSVCVCMCVS